MPREELKAVLRRLAEQIDDADDIGAEAEARLKAAVEEIQDALSGRQPEGTVESMRQRMEEAADDFEDSHPTLASTLGQLGDLLSRVGL